MRILVLSYYYPPDLSAGSFRTTSIVKSLRLAMPLGSQIDVVTTLPNRYKSFTAEAQQTERHDGLMIHRIAVPSHRSGIADQSLAFLTFSQRALRHVKSVNYDIVYATSSRLMTAVLGAWIAKKKRARLYLDIRDIFVETIGDVLPKRFSWAAKPVFSSLERWAVGRADRVNLVSKGFESYFFNRYPTRQFSFFTNGIDDEFLAAAPKDVSPKTDTKPLEVVYAGNIGEGQGLHQIIPELAKRVDGRMQFTVVGDGGRKPALLNALEAAGVGNVKLLPPMQRSLLLELYRNADVLFLHLNDYDAFKKVLPSKLFEYAAMGKPIWAGISGYPAEFVTSEIANAGVFAPCNATAAVKALDHLVFQDTPRPEFVRKYSRSHISMVIAEDIITAAKDRS